MKKKIVTIKFIYDDEGGWKDSHYKQKAFDEIYNSDDVLNADEFEVKTEIRREV